MIFWVSTEQYNDFWSDVKDETVGQFTGLHDKNGKEIYEGDIVRFWWGAVLVCAEIVYRKGGHCFDIKADHFCQDEPEWSDFEVIGNIYENPNLLDHA